MLEKDQGMRKATSALMGPPADEGIQCGRSAGRQAGRPANSRVPSVKWAKVSDSLLNPRPTAPVSSWLLMLRVFFPSKLALSNPVTDAHCTSPSGAFLLSLEASPGTEA